MALIGLKSWRSFATGLNLLLSIALGLAGMSSASGRCHTFDVRADGYARGEATVGTSLRSGELGQLTATGSAVRSDGRWPPAATLFTLMGLL